MKLAVVADNYTVNFNEDDNIVCLEGFFTAKNVVQSLGYITKNYSIIGMHVKGSNTIASGKIIINGTLKDNNSSYEPTCDMWSVGKGSIKEAWSTGNINWFFFGFVQNSHMFDSGEVKVKIDNASVFTGHLFVRIFYKVL